MKYKKVFKELPITKYNFSLDFDWFGFFLCLGFAVWFFSIPARIDCYMGINQACDIIYKQYTDKK